MKLERFIQSTIAALLAALCLLPGPAWSVEGVRASATLSRGVSLLPTGEALAPAQLVELLFDPGFSDLRVPPPPQLDLAAKGLLAKAAAVTINYMPAGPGQGTDTCATWPENAKAAFTYSATLWGSLLQSPVPISINACWASNLGSGVLGHAGASNYFKDFTGAPVAGTWYPAALANALHGSDLDPSGADIYAAFSSTFNWYFGTDGNTPASQMDFVSVLLHEMGHGLGFSGSMQVSGSQGSWGGGTTSPLIYDRYTENNAGQALINTSLFPNPSTALATQLQSNAVFFDASNANAGNGGSRVPLYAPTTFRPGSSYSHLAESFNNTPNALMTFSLAAGESLQDPGPVTMGMFKDMGWALSSGDSSYALTVKKSGSGTGTVSSSPAGINCGATCAASFASGTSVTLTAAAGTGSTFTGWSGGGCSGAAATCTVVLTAATGVTATFSLPATCTFTLNPASQSVGAGASTGTFTVTASGSSCPWSATSGVSWITTVSTGTGSGPVTYAVQANPTTSTRTGTILAGGETFAVTQAAGAASSANALVNGDFESGTGGWTQSSGAFPIISSDATAAHAGSGFAWLGGYNNALDNLQQVVTIPSTARSATVRFWYRIETQETLPTNFDNLALTVRNPTTGNILATLTQLTNANATQGWVQSPSFDVTAYKGMTIRLQFSATTDASLLTNFFVDDVTLVATNDPAFDANVRAVVSGYYQTILSRPPDSGGLDFWANEAARLVELGADVREVFFAMSISFFASSEYVGKKASDTQYVTDLYRTFFKREPDAAGLAYWIAELVAVGSRSALLNSFLFSAEFSNQMTALFGANSVRPEVTMAIDLFRGSFGRLPDSDGLRYWLGRIRTAQCQSAAAIANEVNSIAGQFFNSGEYNARGRGNREFVGDVYNAYLRRGPGGDAAGFSYWAGQVPALGRDGVRAQFVTSAEFQSRVAAVAAAGCLGG